mmetsp:Transcript_32847/g.63592  ORF Transcript_32847/g.63592 Transcript_32847/m.63592 type:complete len:397 (-) Transcript_32847:26-1216(-)
MNLGTLPVQPLSLPSGAGADTNLEAVRSSLNCSFSAMPSGSSKCCRNTVGFATNAAFLLFDSGWLAQSPVAFLLGACSGILLQVYCTILSLRYREACFSALLQGSMLLWIVSNSVWAGCELIWPPVGLFAELSFTRDLDPGLNAPVMTSSLCAVIASAFILAVGCIHVCTRRRNWATGQSRPERGILQMEPQQGVDTLVAFRSGSSLFNSMQVVGRTMSRDSHALRDAEERLLVLRHIYILPFLVADASWCCGDLLEVVGAPRAVFLVLGLVILSTGGLSLAMGCRGVLQDLKGNMYSNACLLGSDVLWVAGNILWALEDTVPSWEKCRLGTVLLDVSLGLFGACGVGMAVSLLVKNHDGPPRVLLAGVLSVASLPTSHCEPGTSHTEVDDITASG